MYKKLGNYFTNYKIQFKKNRRRFCRIFGENAVVSKKRKKKENCEAVESHLKIKMYIAKRCTLNATAQKLTDEERLRKILKSNI